MTEQSQIEHTLKMDFLRGFVSLAERHFNLIGALLSADDVARISLSAGRTMQAWMLAKALALSPEEARSDLFDKHVDERDADTKSVLLDYVAEQCGRQSLFAMVPHGRG